MPNPSRIALLDQARSTDATGVLNSVVVYFYSSGTNNLATIYSDAALTTPATNPVSVAAGGIFPTIYLDTTVAYRRRVVFGDGSFQDVDPFSQKDVAAFIQELSGVPLYSTDLGAFTGQIIPDNVPIKSALQALETGLEQTAETVGYKFDKALAAANALARKYPPGSGSYDCSLCWPSASPSGAVAYMRLPNNIILVRIAQNNGWIRELGLLRITGQWGISDGVETLYDNAYYQNRFYPGVYQSLSPGAWSSTLFAIRHGLASDTLAQISANIAGTGHGQLVNTGANLQANGAGPNLLSLTNLPLDGVVRFATSLVETSTYRSLLRDNTTQALSFSVNRIWDASYGVLEDIFMSALIPNIVWIDSPVSMHVASTSSGFNRAKLSGEARVVELIGSGGQKGNWRKSELIATHPTTQRKLQFWNSNEPSVLYCLENPNSAVGPWIQNQAETLNPYEYCLYGAVHVSDEPDFAKFTPYAVSGAESSPVARAFPMGDTHRFYARRFFEIAPNGAS